MKVELSRQAQKYLDRQDKQTVKRIAEALRKLSKEPPQGDIKALEGQDGFRVRVGNYRIKFIINDGRIIVDKIAPRGEVYKK